MSFLSKISGFFKGFFGKLAGLIKLAKANGLTEEVVVLAEQWVKVAATKVISDGAKREFVVGVLISKGVPESIARLAVELAYQALKDELDKIPALPFTMPPDPVVGVTPPVVPLVGV